MPRHDLTLPLLKARAHGRSRKDAVGRRKRVKGSRCERRRIPAEECEGAESGTGEDTLVETEDERDGGSGRDFEEKAGLKEWTCQ